MVAIPNWFKNKSMSTQFAICNILLTILLQIIIGLQSQLHIYLLMPQLATSQKQLMALSSRQSLNSIIQQKTNLMVNFLDQKSNQLMALHQLTLRGQEQTFTGQDQFEYDYQYTQLIPPLLLDSTPVYESAPMTNSFMCAQNRSEFNVSETKKQQIIGFSNFMGVIGQMFNTQIFGVDQFNYGAIFTNPQILFSYPCLDRGVGFEIYVPNKRPWFIKAQQIYDMQNSTNQYIQFTDPYIFTQNSIDVSLVIPQVDLNNKFIGAWAIDFSGSVFTQYIQTNDVIDKIFLVTRSGILLVHNFENNDRIVPLHIYNETITGYTKDDWELIMNNSDSNNNCNKDYSIPGYFCRYNTLQQKDLHVISSYIKKYEIFVVLISDQTVNEEIINKESQRIADFISSEFAGYIYQSISIFVIHTIFTITILSITIIKPIKRVIGLINAYLHPNQENCIAQYRLLIKVFNSVDVQKLLRAFNTLLRKVIRSQLKKNKICQLMEKFQYSRSQKHIKIPFPNLYKQCQNTKTSYSNQFNRNSMPDLFKLINIHQNK